MKKILITGAEGFVAEYLYNELKDSYNIEGTYFLRHNIPYKSYFLDVMDYSEVEKRVSSGSYDSIFHLAGQSSAKVAKNNFYDTYRINILGALNFAEAITKLKLKTRFIFISTSDVYGTPKYLPIDEKHPLSPLNAYSDSKRMAEEILKKYTEKQLNLVITRAFNHTGRNQTTNFFIPSIIQQVKNIKDKGTIQTGNLSLARDFSDVRDVVSAYKSLIEIERGIYNISSEKSIPLREIVDYVIKKSKKEITIEEKAELIRKGEPKDFYGSSVLIKRKTGWKRKYNLFDTIDWMIKDE